MNAASDRHTVRTATGPISAIVDVPGSKSIANRALVCAALADGTSTLHRIAPGDDTKAMCTALSALGIGVRADADNETVEIDGIHPSSWTQATVLHAGLAGTTSRFLLAMAGLSAVPITIDGDEPLRRRPMTPLLEALGRLGAEVERLGTDGLPVRVTGPMLGRHVELPGDISSQFVTALMLVGPLLPQGLEIELVTPLVSRPYVELTSSVMRDFGIDGVEIGARRIVVPPGQYRPGVHFVEPDASSASYPLAAAAICGGDVSIPGLGSSSRQGDIGFVEILARMGVEVGLVADEVRIRADGATLRSPGEIDLADMSDLVPTVAVLAAFAESATRITGVGFIRAKESDRIGDLAAELRRCGVTVVEEPDGLVVEPIGTGTAATLRGAVMDTHHDHRLAMALSLIGLRVEGIVIDDASVVSKSWPRYWEMLDALAEGDERNVIAAFDVDGTLTRRDSFVPFLLVQGRLRLLQGLARRLPEAVRAVAKRDRDALKAIAVASVFAGLDLDEIEAAGRTHAAKIARDGLRDDVRARLEWHQAAGHRVVLVSASLGAYLRPLGAHLGVDGIVCTELGTRFEAGKLVCDGSMVEGNCRAAAKVTLLERWMRQAGAMNAEIWAYGDSAGDDELLARADRPTRIGRRTIAPVPVASRKGSAMVSPPTERNGP
jgi:3-phosphoshikimate 1-carboxyvinyltransferase